MKKITSFLKPLAVTIVLLAGVNSASALQLKLVSPVLNPATGGGGHPTWFQDQNSIAIQPPIQTQPPLPPLTGFPDVLPATGFPVGFPPEFFYYMLQSATVPMGNTEVDVLFALEASWIDQQGNLVPAGGPAAVINPALLPLKAVVFQRMRMRVKPTGPLTPGAPINTFASGDYRIDHPWGTTTFTCVGPGGNNSACQETTDIGTAGDGVFTAALGFAPANAGLFFGFDTFAKATNAIAPALGDGVTSGPIISAGITPLLRNNIVITPPAGGGLPTTISNFVVVGKTMGMEITPPATGTDFGAVGPLTAAVKTTKTFNVHNLTGAAVTGLTFSSVVPNSNPVAINPEFTIAAPLAFALPATKACDLGGVAPTMAIDETCSFAVTFTPNATDGPKTANISIAGIGAPTAQTTVTGTADSLAPAMTLAAPFARVSTTKPSVISGTVEALATVTVNALPATVIPVPSTATDTNTKWSFAFPAISSLKAGANPAVTIIATDAAGNTTTLNPSITGIVPDGIVAPNATAVSIADAQLALRFASGLSVPTPEQNIHADVAPLIGGVPTPNDKLDIGDVVLILRKVVAPASW